MSGCGAVRLARTVRGREVVSSNLTTPTISTQNHNQPLLERGGRPPAGTGVVYKYA